MKGINIQEGRYYVPSAGIGRWFLHTSQGIGRDVETAGIESSQDLVPLRAKQALSVNGR
ncbi:MAG: hypothetical protein ACE5KG_03545 [Nitrososphaerales archaeon]